MSLNIKKQIRSGLPQVGVKPYGQIHLHSTGNPNSTAQNEADYMNRKDINSGFFTHVVGNGQIIQTANTNRGAYDLGGGWNAWGYASIELIESHKNKDEFMRDYKLYIELARQLAKEAGIRLDLDSGNLGIITHQYATYNQPGNGSDHVDPYPYLKKWGITKQQLAKDLKNGVGVVTPPKRETPQGDWIKENKKVKVTKKDEKIWSNFDWKFRTNTNDVLNKEYNVTGKYNHENGYTYYSLYDNKGGWHGYINKDFVTEVNTPSKLPKGFTVEKGTFINGNTPIQVRIGNYGLNAKKGGLLPAGASIKYDGWINDGTYTWVTYKGYTGDQLFLPVRHKGKAWGTFK